MMFVLSSFSTRGPQYTHQNNGNDNESYDDTGNDTNDNHSQFPRTFLQGKQTNKQTVKQLYIARKCATLDAL